ncbi:unnamed protein product [Allacma fusca]|uniref:Extended synaptotagmin-2 n=1 Tax=Allacma fusca TaxID=39272 RepID=A0A8J2NUG5_9HEXA|nr:unnamed protein product [Allacma fusca]
MDAGDKAAVDPGSAQCSSGGHPGTSSDNRFMPIGPASLNPGGKGKKYKFVEPPGISSWMFSFAKKCFVCGLVYSMGYFQISVGWLVGPIVLLVVRDQWRRHHDSQRAIAAAAARGDEREIVLARLGDNLPSWVIFPDVERAEWLNQILKQLWPKINNYTFELVREVIEPPLRDALATSYKMGSFRFEKIILGDNPVRVRGVKVYDEKKTDRSEIIMDLDIVYASDCDIRISVAKIRAGIKDLHLSGTLRLVMKPLINQIPLIGGVQYFFLNPPSLDFNLIGAADLFDMPGLSDLIRRIVQEQICAMCVLPNKMFIQLSDQVNASDTCITRPQGVVRICAIEAKNLLKKDVGVLGTGKSDPYVVLSVGAQQHKSKIINNTVNPKWEYYCEMVVEELGQILNVVLYDYDDVPRNDEFLGRTSVDLSLVSREGTMDVWLELEEVKKGAIHLKLSWMGFSDNPAELKNALIESQNFGLASCLLTVRLDSAKNLPVLQKKNSALSKISFKNSSNQVIREGSKPDPYVILSVGKVQYESVAKEKTSDPVYEQVFHFLVRNPLTDTLLLKVVDKKSGVDLGAMKQSLDLVYHRPDMKMEKQSLSLNTKSDAKIMLTMEMHVLKQGPAKSFEPEETDEADEDDEPSSTSGKASHTTDDVQKQPVVASNSVGPKPGPTSGAAEAPSGNVSVAADGDNHGLELEPLATKNHESEPLMTAPKSLEGEDQKVRLTIRYSQTTHQLIVVVHTVTNLPIEREELPDPYVKLYVLPERSKKHKTEAKKDQCNPVYDERFEFPVIDLRGKTLHVQVCDKKFIRSSPRLGEVYVALDDFQLGNVVTSWYPLTV